MSEPESAPTRREPAFNVPRPVLWLILTLVVLHLVRISIGSPLDAFALTATDFNRHRYLGLLTYQLEHGGWTHLLMNSAFILAFGAPVARRLGAGLAGQCLFLVLFFGGGAIAGALYGVMANSHTGWAALGPAWALVGASGSGSALMGAAARLMDQGGRLGPLTGRRAMMMTLGWIVVNVVLGVSGLTPGAGDAPVAWQAHIFGYFAGFLSIGPLCLMAGPADDHENAF